MLAPGIPAVMQDYHTDSTSFATFAVSIFVLGFACGSLILPPLSEMHGRVVVYHATDGLFLLFTAACGLAPGESTLLAFRFLSGFAGVASITIGSGTIADLMPREQRGRAVSIWSVGTILGPMVGPIIGGYVADVLGWRWMFWIMAIVVSFSAPGEFKFGKKGGCQNVRRLIPPWVGWPCFNLCLFRLGGDLCSSAFGAKSCKIEKGEQH